MPGYEIDASQWPVLVVRFHGRMSDAEFDRHCAELSGYLRRCKRFALVLDCTDAQDLTRAQRTKAAQFCAHHSSLLTRDCAAISCALPAIFGRFKMSGLLSLAKSTCPRHNSRSSEKAVAWARTQLMQAGARAAL